MEQTLEEPSLRKPEFLAQLTETYEQAEHKTATRYGIKLAKVKDENLDCALTGGLIGAILSALVIIPIFAILR